MMVFAFAGVPGPSRRPRPIVAKLGGFLRAAMRIRTLALLAALLPLLPTAPARAQGYSRPALHVISQAFAATGGSSWYLLRGWRETGRRGATPYESWVDPVRYGLRTETREREGLRIQGFNGQAVWQVDPAGAITAANDRAALAAARTEAFFAADCYLFPGRFDARGEYLGVRSFAGRAYDVLRVTPWGGLPRELWFDRANHLLGRIVDRSGGRPSAIRVSDYRRVGPIRAAFRFTPENIGGAPDSLARDIESLAFTPADRDLFSLNRPEALAKVQREASNVR